MHFQWWLKRTAKTEESDQISVMRFILDKDKNIFTTCSLRKGATHEEIVHFAEMLYLTTTGKMNEYIQKSVANEDEDSNRILLNILANIPTFNIDVNNLPAISPTEVFRRKGEDE